ncbi:DUF11 domain-containing protein [Neorhodopirellula pilleata]|nr:DUF11 domain-containing protein [Neorhodopirellula pilleata]
MNPYKNARILKRDTPLRIESLESRRLMASDLLLAGIDAPSSSLANHGTVSVIDLRDNEVSPIRPTSFIQSTAGDAGTIFGDEVSGPTEGVTGMASLKDGRVARTVSLSSNRTTTGPSELVVQSSVAGSVVVRADVRLNGQAVSVADLTHDVDQRHLVGITAADPSSPQTARLIRIDPDTGLAEDIGDTGLSGQVSIAMAGDGTLYAVSQQNGFTPLMLHRLNVQDGSVLDSRAVVDVSPFGFTTGLAVQPDTGLLFASESHLGRFFTIDPTSTGTLTRDFLSIQPPLRGVSGDVSFVTRQDSTEVEQLFHADFNANADGFEIDNSGGEVAGMWHRSLGRREDGQLNHSLSGSFYYGLFEGPEGGGNTIRDRHHRGVIVSPEVDLPADGTSILSFSYLLDTRPELNRDFVTVSINDGTNVTTILSRADGTLPETRGDWLTATHDLSAFAGQTIRVEFEYDSGDPVLVDPEGWYVDDVIIVHLADPPPLQVDLTATKTADFDEVAPGDTLVYTITVTNQTMSETDGTMVTVADTLPPEVTLDPSGTTEGYRVEADGRILWELDELPVGETETFLLAVRVNDSDVGGEVVVMTNSVTVTAAQPDPNPDDNTAEKDVDRVTPVRIDLAVTKAVDQAVAAPNETLVYTITVTNTDKSNATATAFTVTDTLPEGVTLVESGTTPGFAILPDNRIQWTAQSLAIGQSPLQYIITATINNMDVGDVSRFLTNTVAVEDTVTDDDNDQAEATTEVPPAPMADLSINKTVDNANPVIGEAITFTIMVTNSGTSRSDATGVMVTDVVPAGLTITDIVTTAGTYDPGTGVWEGFGLSRGSTETLTIVSTVEAITGGRVLVNTASAAANQEDPDDTNDSDSVTIIPTQTVQFITPLSVFRQAPADNAIPDLNPDLGEITVSGDEAAIIGFAWADIDLDGQWDSNEQPRAGYSFFLDLNRDTIFDPQTEPQSLSDSNGRYVFTGLTAGEYLIRETDFESGVNFLSTFPVSGSHLVNVSAGEIVSGASGQAQTPNFGGFEFATLVRPADQFTKFVTDPDYPLLLPSLVPWQAITVTNPTDAVIRIESLDDSRLSERSRELIQMRSLSDDDTFVESSAITFPIEVPVGGKARFLLLYDPAIRDESTNRVESQFPDWLNPEDRLSFHTFGADERIELVTDTGLRFPVHLAGGSTFDSDVSHDGTVDVLDFNLLDDLLLPQPVIVKGVSERFDPTADVNARCPNGADTVTGTCTFPVGPTPQREIGLGDFGPLNVEFVTPASSRSSVELVDAALKQIFG